MKRFLITTAALVSLSFGSYAAAAEMRSVFLGSNLGTQCGKAIATVAEDFLQHAGPGDGIAVYSTDGPRKIDEFVFLENNAAESPTYRLQKSKPFLLKMARFCHSQKDGTSQTHVSDLLRYIGEVLNDGESNKIVVLGPPLDFSEETPTLGLTADTRPNDFHLLVDRERSKFGTLGEEDLLNGQSIYWSTLSDGWGQNAKHRDQVQRFVHHAITKRSGSVGFFDDDTGTVLEMARKGRTSKLEVSPLDLTDHKLFYIKFEGSGEAVNGIFDRALSPSGLIDLAGSYQNNVSIGASWSGAVDVDLYVHPKGAPEAIFYGNTQTEYGRLIKDHLFGGPGTAGFETVELTRPVRLDELNVFVNLFSGEAPNGVEGKIRIAIGDYTYEGEFRLDAQRGTQGENRADILNGHGEISPAWQRIDLVSIVNANPEGE